MVPPPRTPDAPFGTPPDSEATAFVLAQELGYVLERADAGYVLRWPDVKLEAPVHGVADVLGFLGYLASWHENGPAIRARLGWAGPIPVDVRGVRLLGLRWLLGDDTAVQRHAD